MSNSSWYRVGSVDVEQGSVVVKANETHWDSSLNPAAPKVGDIFSLDGVTLYEITAIDNEKLILDRPYLADTAQGFDYCIIRVSSHSSMTEILSQVTYVFNLQKRTVDELSNWATVKEISAPITDPIGNVHNVATPFAMDSFTSDIFEIEHLVGEAKEAADLSGEHSVDAGTSSQSSADSAGASAVSAQESADNADKLATVAADLVKTQHIVAALHPLY